MRTRYLLVTTLIAGAAAGCAQVRPEPQVRAAGALAGERIGQTPDWLAEWDRTPPDWQAGDVLAVEDAVGFALRNNRALRGDLALIGQLEADRVQAGLWKNPSAGLGVMFPAGGGLAMLRGTLPMVELQDLWLIPERKRAAAGRVQEVLLRIADRAVALATEVRRLYAELQYSQQALALMQSNITLADQSVQIIQMRQTAGAATQVSTNLARIRSHRLQSDLIALEANYRAQQRDLLLLMGFPDATDAWRVSEVDELAFDLPDPPSERALLQAGIEQRLDLLAAGWNLQVAARDIALARRAAWPDLKVGVSFERPMRGPGSRGPTLPARVGNAAAQSAANQAFGVLPGPIAPTVQPWRTQASMPRFAIGPMFEVEIPIFDQNQAQIARAVYLYHQRRAEFDDRAQTITRDVRTSLVRYAQARDQAAYYRRAVVPEVQRNLELAQQSFTAGQEDLTVYLSTQEDVIMTRLQVLAFVRDGLVAQAELQRAVGGRLPATQPPIASEDVPDGLE